ncbi:MAG TPA: multicopper oxidase domain-containing protein [Thermoleophilaceae bacterium]|nr:multicopper oxidase domain-containing protein [Thermoleophilaceae bacterium]
MSEFSKHKLSRRRLLGGAAGAAALPVLHELVPHAGVHDARARAAGGHGGHRAGEGATPAAHKGAAHRGTVGRVDPAANGFDPAEILRDFDEGKVRRVRGRTVREWDIEAEDKEIEVAPGVKFAAWTYNGRVPGPTLRAREGERLRINFVNGSSHPHTMHFHGIHRDIHDGIPGVGRGNIEPGGSFTYEFDASPFGLHLYHCHSTPLAEHIAKGLYGAFIIDPKKGRPKAEELVMVMNGFDTNFDRANEVYAVNTVAFAYHDRPIRVKRGELVRMYVVNTLEFDLLNSFHVHANFFDYYPTGTKLEPRDFTDTVVMGQGERGIAELRFPYTGKYMFHAHVSEFADLGWMGFFEVV